MREQGRSNEWAMKTVEHGRVPNGVGHVPIAPGASRERCGYARVPNGRGEFPHCPHGLVGRNAGTPVSPTDVGHVPIAFAGLAGAHGTGASNGGCGYARVPNGRGEIPHCP
jgi:hypothetical protein